jgi:uncharacterized membrane protein YgcG
MSTPNWCRYTRINRRLRPMLADGSEGFVSLEPRLLLSATAERGAGAAHMAAQERLLSKLEHHHPKAAHPPKRLTPAQEINAQYAAFTAGFANVLNNYVNAINEQSTNMVTVSATLTAAYAPPAAVIQVNNASVFGPEGTFSPPVVANAVIGTVSFGNVTLTGSTGNMLIVDPAEPPIVSLPVGTILTASVSTSAQNSAAAIFPTYITDSTIEMAINLVKYFNKLPIKLPPENTPPHTPVQRGAIQTFVYDSIAAVKTTSLYQYTNGNSPPSLQQLLLAIPLPTTPGSDLQIYEAAVTSAIAESHQQLDDAVGQIFNRSLLVSAQPPANRLGEDFNSNSGSSTGGSSSSTGSSTGSTGASTSSSST